MPVIVNDTVAVHSGGASNSVHRLFMWTFQLCNRFRRAQVQFLVFWAVVDMPVYVQRQVPRF